MRREDLAGRGEVGDETLAAGRREALGEVERAGGVGAHAHGDRPGLGQRRAQRFLRAGHVKQIPPQRVKARVDVEVAAAGGGVRPGAAGVAVLDRGAQQRALLRRDLHHGVVRRVDGAAEAIRAQRLPAGRAQREGRARVGEEEIVVDRLAHALGKVGELRHILSAQREQQQRYGDDQHRAGDHPALADARRAPGEQQRQHDGQKGERAHVRAQKRDGKQDGDAQQRQREEGMLAARQRCAHAGQHQGEDRRDRAGIRRQRQRLAPQKERQRRADGGELAAQGEDSTKEQRKQRRIGQRPQARHAVKQEEQQRDERAAAKKQRKRRSQPERQRQRIGAAHADAQRRQRVQKRMLRQRKERLFHRSINLGGRRASFRRRS